MLVGGEPVPFGYHSPTRAVAAVPDATVVAPSPGRELAGRARTRRSDRGRRARRRRGAATPRRPSPPAHRPRPTTSPTEVLAHDHAAVQGRLRVRGRPRRAGSTSSPHRLQASVSLLSRFIAGPVGGPRRRSASTWARHAAPARRHPGHPPAAAAWPRTPGRTSPCSPPTSARRRGQPDRPARLDRLRRPDAHELGRRHGRVLLRARAEAPGATSHDGGRLVSVVWGPAALPLSPYADPTTMLHEMAHNLGAVQGDAPNSTGNPGGIASGHCTDEWDVMCYADGGPRERDDLPVRDAVRTVTETFDCGGDDYFNPRPPPARGSRRTGTCTRRRCSARARARSPWRAETTRRPSRAPVNTTPAAPNGWARCRTWSRFPAQTPRSGSGASTAARSARRARAIVADRRAHARDPGRLGAASGRRGAPRPSGSTPPRRSCGSPASAVTPTEHACTTSGERRRVRRSPDLVISDGARGAAAPERADRAFTAPATVTATATDRAGSAPRPRRRPRRSDPPTARPARATHGAPRHAPCDPGATTAAAAGAARARRSPARRRTARRSRSAGSRAPAGAWRRRGLPAPGGRARRAAAPAPSSCAAPGGCPPLTVVGRRSSPGPVQATVDVARKRGRRYAQVRPRRPRVGRLTAARPPGIMAGGDRSLQRAGARAVLAPLRGAHADPARRRTRRTAAVAHVVAWADGARLRDARATRPATSSSTSPPRPGARTRRR